MNANDANRTSAQMATLRSCLTLCARYTVAMPPAPSFNKGEMEESCRKHGTPLSSHG